ncbi:hypothetical protein BKA67DRAFT_530575 [Truncatella angustata]|uniref:Chitin deacetylase n=1 Tax=Truncatella angustata TaxID=152316 RepID=A0A9P9A3T6_9PEZI|nr:uncharacterized protein BKA67DRAFT_530575 [Truncatella angustata]KAH6660483.1 hypothetical protein BKA67DRAFT_530575 [Truncatella angustata]
MRPLTILIPILVALQRIHGRVTSSQRAGAGVFAASEYLESSLVRRDVMAGGSCGATGGNAVCASGLCCSTAGICGAGTSFCSAPDCQLYFGPACDANQIPTGQDTSKVPRPLLGTVPYGVSISHCTVNGKVALTFDDGPYIYTSELLDTLKKNSVKATFFIVGNNGGKGQIELSSTGYPAVIQRMYADGHQIGSHSWSHQNMALLTSQQRHDQIVRNEIALVDILGFIPTYFRPPYTQCPTDCLKELGDFGYHVANYDIDTRDWQGDYTYAQNTYSSILTQHSPGSSSWISLAHDIQPNTVHSFAQYMIDQAKKLGYELVPLGQCLGDPETNWYRDPTTGQVWTGNVQSQHSSTTILTAPISSTVQLVALPSSTTTVIKQSAVLPSSSSSTSPTALAVMSPTTSPFTSSTVTPSTSSSVVMISPSFPASSMSTTTSIRISSIATSAIITSLTPSTTPTAVSGGNFGAGTGNQTGSLPASLSSSVAVKPSDSRAQNLGSSKFGLMFGGLMLLAMY